jgi:hypothetical protein
MDDIWNKLLKYPTETIQGACFYIFLFQLTYAVIQKKPIELLHGLYFSFIGFLILYITAILFGAFLLDRVYETIFASLYLSLLTFFHAGVELKMDSRSWARFLSFNASDSRERFVMLIFYCTLMGAWTGSFVLPLDWQRDWQKWPIPLVFGGSVGYIVAWILSKCNIKN